MDVNQLQTMIRSATIDYIKQINYIYTINGIKSSVEDIQPRLFRMMWPIELSLNQNQTYYFNQLKSIDKQIINKTKKIKPGKQSRFEEKKDLNDSFVEQFPLLSESKQKKRNVIQKLRGKKPLFGPQCEAILIRWIMENIQNKVYLSNRDIMNKAQQLSDSDLFKANENWFKSFRAKHNHLIKEQRERLRQSYFQPENEQNIEKMKNKQKIEQNNQVNNVDSQLLNFQEENLGFESVYESLDISDG